MNTCDEVIQDTVTRHDVASEKKSFQHFFPALPPPTPTTQGADNNK